MDFTGLRVSRDGGIGLCIDQISDHHLRLALSHPAQFYGLGANDFLGQPGQIRSNALPEHGNQFTGRSGQQDDLRFFRLKDHTRGSSVVILHDDTALRQHGLLPIVVRQFDAPSLKVFLNGFPAWFMQEKLPAAKPRHSLLGQIILRRTQPAGEKDHIGAVHGCLKTQAQPSFIVSHHSLVITLQPKSCTLLCQKCRIGIDNISQQQLCSNANDFHCHSFSLLS